MSATFVLLVVLLVLMVLVGGKRGFKSFLTLFFNFLTLFFMLIVMAMNVEPVKVTVIGSIIITSITLFYINGFNKKTAACLVSVVFTILLTMLLTYKIGNSAKIQGFSTEEMESVSSFSLNENLDFARIFICQVLIGLLGAIIDVSISIASSMNEIFKNNASIKPMELFKSGMSIGRDVLGTMTNTLLFAYIGGFMYLMIYFSAYDFPLSSLLNKKIFCSEIFQILCSGIGIVLVIPITAFITQRMLFWRRTYSRPTFQSYEN